MALWSPSTARSAGLHSSSCSFAKAHSIRLKSGCRIRLAASLRAWRHLLPLCPPDYRDDEIARPEFGYQHLLDRGLEGFVVDGAIEHRGLDHAVFRTLATQVLIVLSPCGTGQPRRSPYGARPWVRVMGGRGPVERHLDETAQRHVPVGQRGSPIQVGARKPGPNGDLPMASRDAACPRRRNETARVRAAALAANSTIAWDTSVGRPGQLRMGLIPSAQRADSWR